MLREYMTIQPSSFYNHTKYLRIADINKLFLKKYKWVHSHWQNNFKTNSFEIFLMTTQ